MQPAEPAGLTQEDAALAGPDTAVKAAPATNMETSEPAHTLRLAILEMDF
jgi:hypothetical protein